MTRALLLIVNLPSRKFILILDISMTTLLHGAVSITFVLNQGRAFYLYSWPENCNGSFNFQLEFDLQGDFLVVDLDTAMLREGRLQRLRNTRFWFNIEDYRFFQSYTGHLRRRNMSLIAVSNLRRLR